MTPSDVRSSRCGGRGADAGFDSSSRRHTAGRLLRPAARLPRLRRRDPRSDGCTRGDVVGRAGGRGAASCAAVGVQIEPGVVDRIVAEAELQPGGLPLVQHTLSELFGTRTTNTITVADLDEVGGVAGAIGRRAEQIYQSFDDRCRAAVEPVFLRLVSVTEEHGDTRRRVRRTELEQAGIAPDDLDTVLAEYGRHRLLTFDRDPTSRTPTVELATRRCSPSGRGSQGGSRRPARTCSHAGGSSRPHTTGSTPAGMRASSTAGVGSSWPRHGPPRSRFELERRRASVPGCESREGGTRSGRRDRGGVACVTGVLAAAAVGGDRSMAALALRATARTPTSKADANARADELAGLATLAIEEDPERAILLGLAAAGADRRAIGGGALGTASRNAVDAGDIQRSTA